MQKYAEMQGRSAEPQFHKARARHTCIPPAYPCTSLHTHVRLDILAHKPSLFVCAYGLLVQLLVNCARDLPNLPAGYCSVSCFGEPGHFKHFRWGDGP